MYTIDPLLELGEMNQPIQIQDAPSEVQNDLQILLSSVIKEVDQKANEWLNELKIKYKTYLESQTDQNRNPNEPLVSSQTFKEIDAQYRNLQTTLKKIIKHVNSNFEYAAERGKDVIFYFQKWKRVDQDMESLYKFPESPERNEKLRKLYKKYRKIANKYQEAVHEFNGCISEFQAMANNFPSNILTVTSRNNSKTYTVSYNKITGWSTRLLESDMLSALRDGLKGKLATNQPSPGPIQLNKIQLTPVVTMTAPTPPPPQTPPTQAPNP